jgi:glycosyltransferase involved in cell wall biosynthesis
VEGQEAPTVTAVITTRNRWRFARAAIAAAASQRDVMLETIVVDDGSTDETPQQLAEMDGPGLRVIRHPRSRGVSEARNAGIAAARGSWIAFLDDDDRWAPTKLVSQLAQARADAADLSYTASMIVRGATCLAVNAPTHPRDLGKVLPRRNVIGTPSAVAVRTDLLRRAGGFDPDLSILADWDMWLRLVAAGGRGSLCPEPLTAYTIHAGNLHGAPDAARSEFSRLRRRHAATGPWPEAALGGPEWEGWLAGNYERAGRRGPAAAWFLRSAAHGGGARQVGRAARALVMPGRRRHVAERPAPAWAWHSA